MIEQDLLTFSPKGIYCPRADVFIDPTHPVDKAVITHAHSDHARWGHKYYIAQRQNNEILKLRLGQDIHLTLKEFGESFTVNGVKFSFHPAGHIWGSAQVRVEYKGEVWVASGDYKTEPDHFSPDFEPVKCHTFITESTFALPVFQWQPQVEVMKEINDWWAANARVGKASIICAYALGKAQRIITSVNRDIGPIYVHGAVWNVHQALNGDGAQLPEVSYVSEERNKNRDFAGSLIVTPSSALGTSWMRKFQPYEVATVSGWMNVRGIKKRRNSGHGFVLSDHADWDGLNWAIKETGAEKVWVTHGYTDTYARWLKQQGLDAHSVNSLSIREEIETSEPT
ncbi:MAG: ligase-associated DNA damage response exonuclease [Cytophagales bacterium]|nr:ligase-associated DNA damage response exonuclease [Cytophagales bacterium]